MSCSTNVLLAGEAVIYSADLPCTRKRLPEHGLPALTLEGQPDTAVKESVERVRAAPRPARVNRLSGTPG